VNIRRVVVYIVTEARSIDDGESDSNTVFLKLYNEVEVSIQFRKHRICALTNVDWLDFDTLLNVSGLWVIRNLVREDLGLAEGVDKSSAPSPRRACDGLNLQAEDIPKMLDTYLQP